jgi:hypothetical protein
MSNVRAPDDPIADADNLRDEWLNRLNILVDSVKAWAEDLGWSTRRIEVRLEDSEIGTYRAPALILQEEAIKAFLEPIARSAPGAEGVVDLYIMPAYDDIASLYFYGGRWLLHHIAPGTPGAATIREAESTPLSRDTFREVLEEMKRNAA